VRAGVAQAKLVELVSEAHGHPPGVRRGGRRRRADAG
jgi:hypothetical protein